MLAAHNVYRRQIGTPPLEWSTRLAATAQSWANELVQTAVLKHRSDLQVGENLFEAVGRPADVRQVVDSWAAERSAYHPETNSCSGRCGHYTQIIWRDTKRVGCGVAREGRREIWVCNYDPPGNIIGERPY
ncbi:MAG: CAP domain-containing protein [Bryobacteraceae bacterium]